MIDVKLVCRESELEVLKQSADEVQSGCGRVLFLAGEAGVGKTRLTAELTNLLIDSGFKHLQGQCVPESNTPLLAVKEALRNSGLYHIALGTIPPKLLRGYLILDSGLLLAEHGRTGMDGLDSDILAGMLKAVASFVKDALKALEGAIDQNENLMPKIIEAVKCYATIGEICGVMRGKWGEFKASTYV